MSVRPFWLFRFFSNPSLHAPVSNCVSEHVESSPSSEIDKHYIALYCTIPVATAGAELTSAGAKLNGLKQPKTLHQLLRVL